MVAEGLWTNLQVDYVSPLSAVKGGYRYMFVCLFIFKDEASLLE